jgi:hypothetical protein
MTNYTNTHAAESGFIDPESRTELPVEFLLGPPDPWQIVLCNGKFANLILDFTSPGELVPELRIYPSPHPVNQDNPLVLPLPNITVPDDPSPDAVRAYDTEDHDFYIRVPDGDRKRRLIAVDTQNIVPYVKVRTTEDQEWYAADFSDYVVHFSHPR